MTYPLNPFIEKAFSPPITEAYKWLENTITPKHLRLMNLSQAAPMAPPPIEIREAIADSSINEPNAHFYGPVLGNEDLRHELSKKWEQLYDARIDTTNIGITSGCNQAFCATINTLASPGDNIILPSPWYFNHKMWLDMAAIDANVVTVDENMLPSIDATKKLINKNTKAILLITPNNPTGVEYPNQLLVDFYKIAKENNISLIVDETYRDFHSKTDPIHTLFKEFEWENTLVSLYSFSKSYHLTGHRIGAIITSANRLNQAEKFLDSVTICPNQLGQIGALSGLRASSEWLANERLEILKRKSIIQEGFNNLSGWNLKGCGAYFAYVEHPFGITSDEVCQKLLSNQAMLTLPESMFTQKNRKDFRNHIRIAFANITASEIHQMFQRLKNFKIEQ